MAALSERSKLLLRLMALDDGTSPEELLIDLLVDAPDVLAELDRVVRRKAAERGYGLPTDDGGRSHD